MLLFMYIDTGTSSMLFTILIGVLSAGYYFLRNSFMKMKFKFSGGNIKEQDEGRIPYAIFTDSKRYLTIFKPICDEMEKRGEKLVYLTAEKDDPFGKSVLEHKEIDSAAASDLKYRVDVLTDQIGDSFKEGQPAIIKCSIVSSGVFYSHIKAVGFFELAKSLIFIS